MTGGFPESPGWRIPGAARITPESPERAAQIVDGDVPDTLAGRRVVQFNPTGMIVGNTPQLAPAG